MEQTFRREGEVYFRTYQGSYLNPTPQVVRTNVKGAKIVFKKDLSELLERITPENLHGEVDWGKQEGNEIW